MAEILIETGGEETFLDKISIIFQLISRPFITGFCFNMGHLETLLFGA